MYVFNKIMLHHDEFNLLRGPIVCILPLLNFQYLGFPLRRSLGLEVSTGMYQLTNHPHASHRQTLTLPPLFQMQNSNLIPALQQNTCCSLPSLSTPIFLTAQSLTVNFGENKNPKAPISLPVIISIAQSQVCHTQARLKKPSVQ